MLNTAKTLAPRLVTFLMIAMLAIPGMMTGQAMAQGTPGATGNSYVSELSGFEVSVSGDFEITETSVEQYEQGDGEIVTVESNVALVEVSFFDDTDTPTETIDIFNQSVSEQFEEFSVLDSDTQGNVPWSIAGGTSDGVDYGFYISVMPDVVGTVDQMTFLLAPVDEFASAMENAQVDVLVDGTGVFSEADPAALEATLSGTGPVTDETPVAGQGTSGTATATETTSGQEQGGSTRDVTVSEVTGIKVETSGDWRVSNVQVYDETEPAEESFQIQSSASNGYIGFFYDDNAQQSLKGFLGGFDSTAQSRENIAEDYANGVAWSLDHAVLGDGTEVYVYTEVREGMTPDYVVLSAVLATPEDFIQQFTSAQESIQIDGKPLFVDVDASELETMLSGGSVSTEEATTPEVVATEEPTLGEGDNPREHAKLPGKSETEQVDQEDETETGASGTATAGATDFADAGLISDTEYQSPQFGVDVSWGPSWHIDYSDDESVTSDVAGEMDSLMLVWDGPDFALMFIDISTADGLVPADFVDFWTSTDYMSENVDPQGQNLLDRSRTETGAVLTRDYLDSGEEVVIVKEAILLDDGQNLAIVTLISTPATYDQLYADAQNGVEIAGGPSLSTFTLSQVEQALGR